MALELRPHQIQAKNKLANGKILWGGVGSGKSITSVAYYIEKEAPRNVYVITTAKKRDDLDWEKEFAKVGVGKAPNATVAGLLTVDSWNNLHKYKDVEGAFFIFDEQRLVGSGEWSKNFLRLARCNRWILLTATPGDTWLDYIPVFVANGYYKNRTEFKRDHVVYNTFTRFPKVDRYIGTGKLNRIRSELLVEMPYLRHTVRREEIVGVEYDQPLMKLVMEQRWNPFKEEPLRDVAELFHVMRRVANSNTSRLEAVKQLLMKHPRLIVFYNFNYELESLRSLSGLEIASLNPTAETPSGSDPCLTLSPASTGSLPSASTSTTTPPMSSVSAVAPSSQDHRYSSEGKESTKSITIAASSFTSVNVAEYDQNLQKSLGLNPNSTKLELAEWNGHKHQPIPESDRWVYLVQYTAGAEGWNCITTDAMCFYSLPYSYKLWEQAHGRIDRLNTPYSILHYYVLKSGSMIDGAIAMSLAGKQSFNEKRFVSQRADIRGL